ncbi:MAG TPA: DUF4399 domain-containing protein [Gammaproteobacteria bacterium]|nr:DUF4399 domain-containing protein [Gammaproteobacteria bacterium]
MLTRSTLILLCGALVACGQQTAEPPAPTESPTPAAASSVPTAAPSTSGLTRKPAPAGAMAYIIAPTDGAVVSNPVRVVFGLKGIGVVPAGIDRPDAGHHHLLIDADLPPLDLPIPADAQHVHFGQGQTETVLTLTPGRHQLRLLLGDHLHVPHEPPIVSVPVTIEVR